MTTYRPGAPVPQPQPAGVRPARAPLNAAQVFGITVFPLLGTGLALAGTPVDDVFILLSGCGAIGVATIALGSGARRMLAAALGAAAGHDTHPRG